MANKEEVKKNRAAVALGRLGGKARAKSMPVEERLEASRRGGYNRWGTSPKKKSSKKA